MIALYHGKNTFLSKIKIDTDVRERKEALDEKEVSYEVRLFDGSTTSAETITTEIETPSLFCPHKMLVIKRLADNPEKNDLYEYLIDNLDYIAEHDTIDIFIWEDQKLRSNLRIVKKIKETGSIEESPDFNKRTFQTWGREQAKEREIDLDSNATHLLSERANYDPERFTRELTKLTLLGKKDITEDDIERLCPDTLEHTIWELIDAINDNDVALAEKKLDRVLRQGNDPMYVLLMIARNVRIILLTKLMLEEGASTGDIARKIKAPPFSINAIRKNAQNTSIERIALIYDKLSNIDYSGKTGQLDISLALNILLSVI